MVLAAPQVLEADGSWRQSDPLGALRRLVPGLLEMGAAGVLAFNGAASQAMLAEFLPGYAAKSLRAKRRCQPRPGGCPGIRASPLGRLDAGFVPARSAGEIVALS